MRPLTRDEQTLVDRHGLPVSRRPAYVAADGTTIVLSDDMDAILTLRRDGLSDVVAWLREFLADSEEQDPFAQLRREFGDELIGAAREAITEAHEVLDRYESVHAVLVQPGLVGVPDLQALLADLASILGQVAADSDVAVRSERLARRTLAEWENGASAGLAERARGWVDVLSAYAA